MKSSRKVLRSKANEGDPLSGNLSGLLDKGAWTRVKFELRPKNKTVTLRISEELLDAVKDKAKETGLDYQKWIRIALERLVA